jgi:hypothetical protein
VEHPDPETLALLALGEGGGAHAGHLDGCGTCRSEVAALRRVAAIGVETQEVRDLPPPPSGVWNRVAAATGTGSSTVDGARHASTMNRNGRTAPSRDERTTGPAAGRDPDHRDPDHRSPDHSGPNHSGRVRGSSRGPIAAAERSQRPRQWVVAAVAAAVALAVGIVGTLVATRDGDDRAPLACGRVVAARADLSALPLAPPGATGEARVLCDGPARQLHLRVQGLPLRPGYYQVWLIDPDSMEMTAIGVLGDTGDVLLPLASTTDLRKYRLVDFSAERYDNNQAHSGESLLRGQLTT